MEYWHGEFRKNLNKNDLFVFLSRKATKNDCRWSWRYSPNLGQIYDGFDDVILRNLYRINSIQIYSDGCIRIHLKHGHFETPKSIIIDDINLCYDEGTLEIIEFLDEYCMHN